MKLPLANARKLLRTQSLLGSYRRHPHTRRHTHTRKNVALSFRWADYLYSHNFDAIFQYLLEAELLHIGLRPLCVVGWPSALANLVKPPASSCDKDPLEGGLTTEPPKCNSWQMGRYENTQAFGPSVPKTAESSWGGARRWFKDSITWGGILPIRGWCIVCWPYALLLDEVVLALVVASGPNQRKFRWETSEWRTFKNAKNSVRQHLSQVTVQ